MLLDLSALGVNVKGVARVLTALTPRLAELGPGRYRGVTTRAGVPVLAELGSPLPVTVVPRVPNAVWEQTGLPAVGAAVGARSVYCHQECGALWGPRLVLHVPEDPEIRWSREPTTDRRELARRRYSRLAMDRSLRRADVVTSTEATRRDLEANHGVPPESVTVVPLGVDLELFGPEPGTPDGPPYFFHLASSDARDRTDLIVEGFARFVAERPGAARLVIGGRLGHRAEGIGRLVGDLGIEESVTVRGEVSDPALAALYAGCLASVHAAPDEGFGLQPLEAMASGALLISTPAEAISEVTVGAAVLWSEPTAEGMAAAMVAAASRPALVAEARLVNRACAERFSWDATATALHGMLIGD